MSIYTQNNLTNLRIKLIKLRTYIRITSGTLKTLSTMASIDKQFAEAAQNWDLETLYTDLASAKGKRLTPTEKLHLRGLLCGYSPAEIAEKLGKNPKGVETDLCATIYRYVKSLVDRCDRRIENWRNISEWLETDGYRCRSSPQVPLDSLLPENSVVNVTNINIENNQLVIAFNLRIPTSKSEKISIENFGLSDDMIPKDIARDLSEKY
ncbi:helix-turn-helix transcriptional regulator [Dapis sp. BLCC M229]|uniref:helix-turn-helix transcriptional regulator n=1 Tax=Dapis sp. BLCC M229 TaxID=3400188 RepID=UPI003CF4E9DA